MVFASPSLEKGLQISVPVRDIQTGTGPSFLPILCCKRTLFQVRAAVLRKYAICNYCFKPEIGYLFSPILSVNKRCPFGLEPGQVHRLSAAHPHTKLMPSAPTPTLRGTSPLLTASVELNVWHNPFTPESDQSQISPAASQEIWHHTVWRIWLFKAYSDERWLYYKFSLHHAYNCFLKGWENTLFELRSERVNIRVSDRNMETKVSWRFAIWFHDLDNREQVKTAILLAKDFVL